MTVPSTLIIPSSCHLVIPSSLIPPKVADHLPQQAHCLQWLRSQRRAKAEVAHAGGDKRLQAGDHVCRIGTSGALASLNVSNAAAISA